MPDSALDVPGVVRNVQRATMQMISLESAQHQLPDLVRQLGDGRTITITRGDQPVAQLSGVGPVGQPTPGRCRGMLTIVSDDDEHLADFADYMP